MSIWCGHGDGPRDTSSTALNIMCLSVWTLASCDLRYRGQIEDEPGREPGQQNTCKHVHHIKYNHGSMWRNPREDLFTLSINANESPSWPACTDSNSLQGRAGLRLQLTEDMEKLKIGQQSPNPGQNPKSLIYEEPGKWDSFPKRKK